MARSRGQESAADSEYIVSHSFHHQNLHRTLLAQAAIEKKLSLDDDVRKYLDGDYPNLEFQGHPIRLYDLVNHRSGLPFFLPDKPETLPGYNNEVIPWPTRIAEVLKNYRRKDFFADLHQIKLEAIPAKSSGTRMPPLS